MGLGAAVGASNPDPTTRNASVLLGAQVGAAGAKVAAEAVLQTGDIAEDRFVNSRVNSVLQQEAGRRAAVGGSLSSGEAESIGKQLADSFRLEFQNMMAAVSGTNAATPDLGASFSDALNRALNDTVQGAINGVGQALGIATSGRDGG